MAERKAFLLRLPADLFDGMQLWARDDLRSLNAQIEYVLRDALRRRGRVKEPSPDVDSSGPTAPPGVSGPTAGGES
jgi:hypothetical protein